MTPEQFIAILEQANAGQLAEIRSMLGVPMPYPVFVLPGHTYTTPVYTPPVYTPPSYPGYQPAFPYQEWPKVWCGNHQQ